MNNDIPMISIEKVNQMKLRGKPKCPICNNPLAFIYDDMIKGHFNQKCGRCGRKSLVDVETMSVLPIQENKAV